MSSIICITPLLMNNFFNNFGNNSDRRHPEFSAIMMSCGAYLLLHALLCEFFSALWGNKGIHMFSTLQRIGMIVRIRNNKEVKHAWQRRGGNWAGDTFISLAKIFWVSVTHWDRYCPCLLEEPIPRGLGRMRLLCSDILHVAAAQELGLHPAFNLGAKISDAAHMQ